MKKEYKTKEKDPHRYDKIMDLPHFVSKDRKHMSNYDRAAQFAPFDALTGYDEALDETARTTDDEIFLGESEALELDRRFRMIEKHINERPIVQIRYFVPDLYKEGGMYKTETVTIRRIDLVNRQLISADRKRYDLDYITEADGECFDKWDQE